MEVDKERRKEGLRRVGDERGLREGGKGAKGGGKGGRGEEVRQRLGEVAGHVPPPATPDVYTKVILKH